MQLCLDEQIAEIRDQLFFSRVVNGIEQSKMYGKDRYLQMQNEMCLAHIMQTRTMDATTAATTTATTTTSLYQRPLTMLSVPETDDWSVGLPIDAPPSTNFSEHTMYEVRAITADAIALANQTEDQGMIFDMEL